MKEPLSHKIFAILEPQRKAPVRGFLIEKKNSAPSPVSIGPQNVKLKGSEYELTLPWGVGVATKTYGFWNIVQPELPSFVKSNQVTLTLNIPAANDVKITFKGAKWFLILDRDYDKVDISTQKSLFYRKTAKYFSWLVLAALVHIGLYFFALYVPIKPFTWIEEQAQKGAPLPSFEDQIIEEAKKNTALDRVESEEGDIVKVKFNFFNGLPWMNQKVVTQQNVQRLDNLLKDLKNTDVTIGFDDKGATNAADVIKQANKGAPGGAKGSLISKVFSKSNAGVVPKLSTLQSTNRSLSAAELKLIRATFQAISPEMTLAYQRALAQNPQLSFGLRYETTVNKNGTLGQVKFQTSGVSDPKGLSDLLAELKGIFEKTSIGTGLSGVTIQGENIFKNQ